MERKIIVAEDNSLDAKKRLGHISELVSGSWTRASGCDFEGVIRKSEKRPLLWSA